MVAIKAKVSKLDSCDLEADKVKDEVTKINSNQCKYQAVAADFSLFLLFTDGAIFTDFQVTHWSRTFFERERMKLTDLFRNSMHVHLV